MTSWMNTSFISLDRFLMLNIYFVFSLCFGFETASQHRVCKRLGLISLCNQRLSESSCLHFVSAGITCVHYPSFFLLLSFRGYLVAFIRFFIDEQPRIEKWTFFLIFFCVFVFVVLLPLARTCNRVMLLRKGLKDKYFHLTFLKREAIDI